MILRKRTLTVILLLALLLCLLIEAAEAGLLLRFKSNLSGLFQPFNILLLFLFLLAGVIAYVALVDKSLNLKENSGKDGL